MNTTFKRIIHDEEVRVNRFIQNQITDKNNENYGGYVYPDKMWTQPKQTIYNIANLYSLYNLKESKYYHDEDIYKRVLIALDFVARNQNPDGTFDLLTCNFDSAPDTAFCVLRLLPTYHYLEKHCDTEENKLVFSKIKAIIEKAAKGICNGGFHTPNHRWIISAVLIACAHIFNCSEYIAKANEYLNEGIDCNKYGEYAERSSGNYNRINDDAMILLYEETGDKKYLEYVERNLNMMFNYFEPDGSIFTKNSTRYDSWCKFYPDDYYYDYLYMSYLTHNATFGAAANKILKNICERGELAPDFLFKFMAHPELIDFMPDGCEMPEVYRFNNIDSNVIRVRNKDVSYSILSKNPHFLYFEVGKVVISMKLGFIYFDKRGFEPDKIKINEDNSITLSEDVKGWFYKPFKEKPQTSDWWQMDNKKRELKEGPKVNFTVNIKPEENGVAVNILASGWKKVPYNLEISVEDGCFIRSENFITKSTKGCSMVMKKGSVEVSKDMDNISIGPCFGSHYYIDGKDGANDRNENLYHIYMTGYTNTDRCIHINKVNERFKENCDI